MPFRRREFAPDEQCDCEDVGEKGEHGKKSWASKINLGAGEMGRKAGEDSERRSKIFIFMDQPLERMCYRCTAFPIEDLHNKRTAGSWVPKSKYCAGAIFISRRRKMI